ncbi:hypothetical protein [Aquipseudomonas alcaligenes]|uniref:phosphoribosyltransferase-like protein n=1 Tax=Aquipseudomonas alcaligenes TaxID=43263 RepID=UPI0011B6BBB6|nr:hypothetical protein [Pseudomonas alcaligenes]
MRDVLINQLLAIISGYRAGQIAPLDVAHVERWLANFDEAVQIPVLNEIVYTLGRTYYSYERVCAELVRILSLDSLNRQFWQNVSLLDIQQGGNSQHDIVGIVARLVFDRMGLRPQINGASNTYIYLDDGIFTGKRAEQDITAWVNNAAPDGATLYVVAIWVHSYGLFALKNALDRVNAASNKNIAIRWVHGTVVEDRKAYTYSSDVLRPTRPPADVNVQNYIDQMIYAPVYRQDGSAGGLGFFSSCAGRDVLEQEFLKAGAYIRAVCRNLGVRQRPLGNSALETLGFGAMMVTYRNCPNNAPLALWVDAPWYPLFPRETNAQAAHRRMFGLAP